MAQRPARGVFVTLEGGDGSGKSTQAAALADLLRRDGQEVCVTGEPAGTTLGRAVKGIFEQQASAGGPPLTPYAEVFLFAAARAQHVAEVIRPALERGEFVLCDRFTDSTLAYQGYGRGLALDVLRACNRVATGGLEPDMTLLFDIPVEAGLARADVPPSGQTAGKAKDAIGQESLEFHRRARDGFLALAGAEPGRITVIDASLPQAEVTVRAWNLVHAFLLAPRTPA